MPILSARAAVSKKAVPAAPAYAANPVNFDGTNDSLSINAALTGIADGQIILFSAWLRTTVTGNQRIFQIASGTNARIDIGPRVDNTCRILARNSAGTNVLLASTAVAMNNGSWHHLLMSINLSSTSERSFLVDGVDAAPTWTTYTTAGVIDLNPATTPKALVGISPSDGERWNGDMADVYFAAPSTWFNPASGGNLALFITGGAPAPPANWPTNGARCGFTGPTATWQDNTLGDNFTEVGALTDGTGPVQL